MRIALTRFVLCMPCVLLMLSACSSGESFSRPPVERHERQFSEEEKRAASLLSVSNNELMAKAESPYSKALLCKYGMDVVGERFAVATGIGDQQRDAVNSARSFFDQRLQDLSASEGKSKDEVAADLKQVGQDLDVVDGGRIAMDCLRRLQESG